MLLDAFPPDLEKDLLPARDAWEELVVPEALVVSPEARYSPEYAWMYTYERHVKRRIEAALGHPLGASSRMLFGTDGVFSEGMSNAFAHGHHRNPATPIRVRVVVSPRGILFTIRDAGPGFDVPRAMKGLAKGGVYFKVAGNGLKALSSSERVTAGYRDGGRTLCVLLWLGPHKPHPPFGQGAQDRP